MSSLFRFTIKNIYLLHMKQNVWVFYNHCNDIKVLPFTFWLECICFVSIFFGFGVRTPLPSCLSSCLFNTCTFLTQQTSTIVNTTSQTPSDMNEYHSISIQYVTEFIIKIYENLIKIKLSKFVIWLFSLMFIKIFSLQSLNFTSKLLNIWSSDFGFCNTAYLHYPFSTVLLRSCQISTMYRF